MDEATFTNLREKQRFNVNIKAVGSIKGQQEHQCLITNLSGTGARLRFETASPVKAGMVMDLKISIPKTIMTIPAAGEIIWVQQNRQEVTAGIKFEEIISETMMEQLIKNG